MTSSISIKKRMMGLVAVTLVTTCLIVVFAMWGYYSLRTSERTRASEERILATVPNQVRDLLIGYLLPEQRAGIPLLLQKYAKEEMLTDARIIAVDEKLEGFAGCDLKAMTSSCLSDDGRMLAVLSPIRDDRNIYGYFAKTQELKTVGFGEDLLRLSIGIIILLFVAFLGLILLLARVSSVEIPKQLDQIVAWMRNRLTVGEIQVPPPKTSFDELNRLSTQIAGLIEENQKAREENAKLLKQAAVADFAARVAHDIRSPLTALGVATENLQQLPEDTRILIRSAAARIREIAAGLLERHKANQALSVAEGTESELTLSAKESDAEANEPIEIELLDPLIDGVTAEKLIQYRSRPLIEVSEKFDSQSYGIFARIGINEFKRVISNLIDNAVEAIDGDGGKVEIRLFREEGKAVVEISDTGKGIPPEVIARWNAQGLKGESGKPGGSGIGLLSSWQRVNAWGGRLQIKSSPGKGTTVSVALPLCAAPGWFVPELNVVPDTTVVIVDDDVSIHQVWQTRFNGLEARQRNVKILHFSNVEEVMTWYRKPREATRAILFLVDYELIGSQINGLELIERMGVQDASILVTSSFEQKTVVQDCVSRRVRLIPKGLAGFVPLRISA